jgi:hypothetical protein
MINYTDSTGVTIFAPLPDGSLLFCPLALRPQAPALG